MQNTKSLKLFTFAVFHLISHHIINKYYKWSYIIIVFTKYKYFWVSPYVWPGIVVRELGEPISMCVLKKRRTH